MENEETVFPLKKAYPYLIDSGFSNIVDFVRNELTIPDIIIQIKRRSSYRRGYLINLMKDKNLLEDFLRKYWENGHSPKGIANMNYCLNLYLKNKS